jgi:hypothetical protein
MMVMREDWNTQRKICPSAALSTNLTCPAWDRTWASVVTDHELIAWAMAWLGLCLYVCIGSIMVLITLCSMWTKQLALYLRSGFYVYKCYPWYMHGADCNYKHTDCYKYLHQWEWNRWCRDITHVYGCTTQVTLDCRKISKVQNILV